MLKRVMLTCTMLSMIMLMPGLWAAPEQKPTNYIRSWLLCGPFENASLETKCLPNESTIHPKVGQISSGKKWKLYQSLKCDINLEDTSAFAPLDNCVGYAYAEIKSPGKRKAILSLGSDDSIKVWLNGENIYTFTEQRGLKLDEDKINVLLNEGWNFLLLKIKEHTGDWGFSARFTDYGSNPIPRLQYKPAPVFLKRLTPQRVFASSLEDKESLAAEYAVDGKKDTRWSSKHLDPQWIVLDFGKKVTLHKIELLWETAYGKEYRIDISDDSINWKAVYSEKNSDGGSDKIPLDGPINAGYVRMYGTKRGTIYGYSLWEFYVY